MVYFLDCQYKVYKTGDWKKPVQEYSDMQSGEGPVNPGTSLLFYGTGKVIEG